MAFGTNFQLANSIYVENEDGKLDVVASRDIKVGEEILVDYHDMLARAHPSDSKNAIALGEICPCSKCDIIRSQKVKESRSTKKRKLEDFSQKWPDAVSEVYQYIIAKYIEALQPPVSFPINLEGVVPPGRQFTILTSPDDSVAGAGFSERSWRGLLDNVLGRAIPKNEFFWGGFLQFGTSCGTEALLTAISAKGFAYCLSVLPTEEAVAAANSTFKNVLLDEDMPPNLRVLQQACPIAATCMQLEWAQLYVTVMFVSQFNDEIGFSVRAGMKMLDTLQDLRVIITTSTQFRDEVLKKNMLWKLFNLNQRFHLLSSIDGN